MQRRVPLLVIAAAIAGCGGSRTSSPAQNTTPATISGREHIAWTQTADSIANYVFLLYVDDVRNQLPQATCNSGGAAGFDCDSPLPPLTNGKHSLQLAAAFSNGATFLEGPKAAAIVVTVEGSADTADSIQVGGNRTDTVAGNHPTADRSPQRGADAAAAADSCGLAAWDPETGLAWTTRGDLELISVATQTSRPLVWSNDFASAPWRLASAVRRVNAAGSWLYMVATVGGDEPAVRLVRYRELNAVLGERAVLLQRALPVPAARAAASFGPDGILYVSFRWTTASTEPLPFVLDVDVDGPAAGSFDPRFLSRDAIATAWSGDGRYWILESSTTGAYSVRAAEDARPSWNFAADAAPIGLETLRTSTSPPAAFAAFAAQGEGLVLADDGRVTPTQFGQSTDMVRQASALLGSTVVSCTTSPRFKLSYAVWR